MEQDRDGHWDAGHRFTTLRLAVAEANALLGMYAAAPGTYPWAVDEARKVLDAADTAPIQALPPIKYRFCAECGARLNYQNRSGMCPGCARHVGTMKRIQTLEAVRSDRERHAEP